MATAGEDGAEAVGQPAAVPPREAAAPGGPGAGLGLPETGSGSLASTGTRLAALLVDVLLSALVAGLLTAPALPRNWSLVVFLVQYVTFTALFGQTPGMRLVGLRVIRLDRPARVGLWRAAVRTVLLTLLVPALIWDRDGRGLHDRACQTAVVRS